MGSNSLKPELQMDHTPSRCWESNPGRLQEQQVLLTTEESLQLHLLFFKLTISLVFKSHYCSWGGRERQGHCAEISSGGREDFFRAITKKGPASVAQESMLDRHSPRLYPLTLWGKKVKTTEV